MVEVTTHTPISDPPVVLDPPVEARPPDNLPAQLAAVRRLIVGAILHRGFPCQDAEDVTQDVLVKIASQPDRYTRLLGDLDAHGAYFVAMAFNTYRMRLRGERRRQRREQSHSMLVLRPGGGGDGLDSADALDLASDAPLSGLQRRYLRAVLDEHLSLEQIATDSGTSTRAVRDVLQRAATVVRRQHQGIVAMAA